MTWASLSLKTRVASTVFFTQGLKVICNEKISIQTSYFYHYFLHIMTEKYNIVKLFLTFLMLRFDAWPFDEIFLLLLIRRSSLPR